jgi:hypothetical protein
MDDDDLKNKKEPELSEINLKLTIIKVFCLLAYNTV